MNVFTALLNLSVSFSLHAQAAPTLMNDACTPLIGSCDYYTCVEDNRLSCGPTGYPLG
ncbi:MAG: hypothetical protein H7249_05190 [Chitinophagaceae bacterium]|nr:hypothetical protein [Oligoflexus sp.]